MSKPASYSPSAASSFSVLVPRAILSVLTYVDICMHSDYSVFLSPLSDFKDAVTEAGLSDKVVYLDRGDEFKFNVH